MINGEVTLTPCGGLPRMLAAKFYEEFGSDLELTLGMRKSLHNFITATLYPPRVQANSHGRIGAATPGRGDRTRLLKGLRDFVTL